MGVDMQMYLKTRKKITPKQVRHLSYDLAEKFGNESFFISRPDPKGFWPEGRHALEIIKKYEQDGPTITPKEGEQFIEVHLYTRYWGEGYERGDILLAINVAEFLESRIPDAKVFMGGDSSGINAELFSVKEREKAKALFFRVGHEPYRNGWSMGDDYGGRHCDFCDHEMTHNGFGKDYAKFFCSGCGLKEETRDGGKTWEDVSKEKI